MIADIQMPAYEIAVDLKRLPNDLRRMLRIQWKEWIHSLEDCESEQDGNNMPDDLLHRTAA
jgi:hypothetical protein